MAKLHEILAVEGSKLQTAKNILKETEQTFSNRKYLFEGLINNIESKLEKDDPKYAEFPDATEVKEVAETVPGKLDYLCKTLLEWFNIVAQKDLANTEAKADLIIDDDILLKNVPSVTLLFIENKMKEVRNLFNAIPVLDTAKVWEPTSTPNVFKHTPTSKVVKESIEELQVVVQQSDKHPAQVAKVVRQEIRAIKHTTELSSFVSSYQKHIYLSKCDKIIEAAKAARQRANCVEAIPVDISSAIFDYLLNK